MAFPPMDNIHQGEEMFVPKKPPSVTSTERLLIDT